MNAPLPCALDNAALQRVRALDPTGHSNLLPRLLEAFEKSVSRMLPQLEQARDAADAAGVHLVAHTLKSSSAAVGALELSRHCALVEELTRHKKLDQATESLQHLLLEVAAAREAVRDLARQLTVPADAT